MIYNDDCLNAMKNIDSNSIDAIIADVPYGVTDCELDKDYFEASVKRIKQATAQERLSA